MFTLRQKIQEELQKRKEAENTVQTLEEKLKTKTTVVMMLFSYVPAAFQFFYSVFSRNRTLKLILVSVFMICVKYT